METRFGTSIMASSSTLSGCNSPQLKKLKQNNEQEIRL